MNEDRLRRELRAIEIPGRPGAEDRVVLAARAAVARPQPTIGRRPSFLRPRAAVAAIVLAALVAAAFTPPGQAVADWVRDLVGRGEVGGGPTLGDDRVVPDEERGGHLQLSEPVVIGTGRAPDGTRFEITTYETTSGRCFDLDVPGRRSSGGGCGYPALGKRAIRIDGADWDSSFGSEARVSIDGEISPEISRVEVRYRVGGQRARTDATLAVVDGALLERIGAEEPFGRFVAFLPQGGDKSKIVAIAYEASGRESDRDEMK